MRDLVCPRRKYFEHSTTWKWITLMKRRKLQDLNGSTLQIEWCEIYITHYVERSQKEANENGRTFQETRQVVGAVFSLMQVKELNSCRTSFGWKRLNNYFWSWRYMNWDLWRNSMSLSSLLIEGPLCAFFKVFFLPCSNIIKRKTKLPFFSSNVMTVLLYGCETWRFKRSTASVRGAYTP